MSPKDPTGAKRQRDLRERRRLDESLPTTEVRGIFAHPEDHEQIKADAAKVNRRRARLMAKRGAP